MRIDRRLLTFLLLALTALGSSAQNLREQAVLLERQGETDEAILAYQQWLNAHPDHPDAVGTLLHAAGLSNSALEALALLSEGVRTIPEESASPVYERMARLETLLGLPQQAAQHFLLASRIGGIQGEQLYLEYLILLYSMGRYAELRTLAEESAARASTPSMNSDFYTLGTLALARERSPEDALVRMKTYLDIKADAATPLAWQALADIAISAGDSEAWARARNEMNRRYPESVNNYLLQRRINRWMSPAGLETEPIGYMTSHQVGAFSSREAAASLRHSLENDGFTAWLEPSGDLWKVFVHDPDGNAAARLKERGY